MGKKFLVLILLFNFSMYAQTHISGSLTPFNTEYNWVILYQLKGVKQVYVANTEIVNGNFSIELPANSPKGMYRLMYDLDKNGFIDFIYNNQSVNIEFNPNNAQETVVFSGSEENKQYQIYLHEAEGIKRKLDSLQITFLAVNQTQEKSDFNALYQKVKTHYDELQQHYEKVTNNKLAHHFIKVNYKYYPTELIATPQLYLNSERNHFFDYINFEDKELLNSTFLTEKIIDYVFYLNSSDDFEAQNKLYQAAIKTIMDKAAGNFELKTEMLTTLLYAFGQMENATMVHFVLNNYYNKLPAENQEKKVIAEVLELVKTAIGTTAPEIEWTEKGKTNKLTTLAKADHYLLVFYSSTCSHCLIEVPKLYNYSQNLSKVRVIAVALEDNDVQFKIHAATFKKWSNILALGKWENVIAKNYGIKSTPTYFILDSHKKIVSKPQSIEDVFKFFGN